MIKKKNYSLWRRAFPMAFGALALVMSASFLKADSILGPVNPGFENGGSNWNSGATGGGSVNFANSPTNGPTAPGTNCVLQTSDGTGNADLRADMFPLGAATGGNTGVTVEFNYNILGPVNFGDQIRIGFRSLDSGGGFQGENNFHIGTSNGDVGGDGWHHFKGVATPSATAVNGDIRVTMNMFGDDTWSSGPVLFDNFSVTTNSDIGTANPGFENGGQNWNSGASGDSSVSFANFPTNGPSAPGTNCVLETSDGVGNCDLRVDMFSLGAATQGKKSVSVDFDYNILGPINFGDQIRVGFRSLDSGGGFQGEHNFYLGTPNNDVGGTGWHHFHGVAAPSSTAVNGDIRISMNIFGDDTWSSGGVLFDNFSIKITPVIGPNINGNFENSGVNWNAGGPGGAGGSETFNYPSNGPSAPGTNCVQMTADGTVTPSGGNDIRVNGFNLANNTDPVTISFDYNILNPVNSGNQIRVGLRYFNNGNFAGENNSYIGTPNGDLGGQGWKHYSAVYTPAAGASTADIRVSMNIFGDDIWSSGSVLFDNFVVITGTNAVTTVNKFTGIVNAGNNNYVLTYSGAPNSNYALETTSSLTLPVVWTPQLTNTTDANGLVMFTNHQAGLSGFWRARQLP